MSSFVVLDKIEILAQTQKAVRVMLDDDEVWIPWSVIEDNEESFVVGYKGKMYVHEWWIRSEGLA